MRRDPTWGVPHSFMPLACSLFSVRSDWESVGFGAGAVVSVLAGGLIDKARVSADVVVFVVPAGEFDACAQQAREGVDVEVLIALA